MTFVVCRYGSLMVEGLTSEEVEDSVVLLVVRQLRRCASDDDLVRLVITQGLVPHIIRSSNHYTNQLSELSEPYFHQSIPLRKLRAELAVSSEVTSLLVNMADTR